MDTLTKEYFEVGEQQVIREFTDLAGNYGADTVNVIVELENNAISVIVENSLVKDFELNIEEYYETKGRETPTKENFNIGFINHETGLLEEVAFQDGTKSTLIEETERRGYDPETPKPGIGLVLDLQFPLNGGAAIDAEGNPLDENYVGLCEDGLPMWHLKVDNILVNVYDNIGQYVTSVVVPEIEIDSPKYLDAEGKAKVYLELSRVSSKFRSVTGRVWGSGVYPITIKARTSAEPINCDLEKRKATISNYSDLKKIGYKRNEQ